MGATVNNVTGASTSNPVQPSQPSGNHTVKRGDTMWGIAKQNNVPLNDLIKANPQIKNPDLIYPGQEVKVPGTKPDDVDGKYMVKAGDTMGHVAKDHNVALNDLMAANPQVSDPNNLRPGSQLNIPGAAASTASHADRGKSDTLPSSPVVNGGLDAPTLKARIEGPQPQISRGSRGPAVERMQSNLAQLGFNPGPQDGIFGPRTQSAVRDFQRSQGLVPDGICGPKTWGALADPQAPRNPTPAAPSAPGGATPGNPPAGGQGTASNFVNQALAQNGDNYVYGAETNLNDPNPHTFDCSELVQWAASRAGVNFPDGSSNQLAHCRRNGTEISTEEAMRTPGALLFRPGHVAISLGDGRTIEARGRNYGVGIFDAAGRFTSGGLIPGMSYGQ